MALVNASLTTTAADVFTCSNAGGSAITGLVFYNSDSIAHTVQFYACPANEAQVVENQLFNVSIPAGESFAPDFAGGKLILANTDTLTAKTGEANSSTAVAVTVSYLNL